MFAKSDALLGEGCVLGATKHTLSIDSMLFCVPAILGTPGEGSSAIFRPTVDISYADGLPRTFLHNGSRFVYKAPRDKIIDSG